MELLEKIEAKNRTICHAINKEYTLLCQILPKKAYKKIFLQLYLKRLIILFIKTFLKPKLMIKTLKEFTRRNSQHLPFYSDRKTHFSVFWWTLLGFNYFTPDNLLSLLSEKEIFNSFPLVFKNSKKPKISIIIPVYNHLPYTYNCLKSLLTNMESHLPYEIIVIDDQSSDSTHDFLYSHVNGIHYIRNEKNLGFLQSCNKAVQKAKGKYIYLLNNDTQIQPNAIEELLKTLENDQTIGCVGSKLVYPNGLLQEAGGVIFADGKTLNYGNLDIPNRPCYLEKREVDYCSGASLLFRKNDFLILGMFDEKYIPAYYEDTDLCMAFKNKLRKKVVYVPESKVIHFESISTGKEAKEGNVKNYLLINRKKFINKWSNVLFNYSNSSEYHKIQDLTKQT